MKVTFDKNVYEFVVDPEKPAIITEAERWVYRKLHNAISEKRIVPFISESILTYESVQRNARQQVMSREQPIVVSSEGGKITISSNPKIHPGGHAKDAYYLTRAMELGFKILPGKRFGKLVSPLVKTEWYHLTEEDYFLISDRFSEANEFLEAKGCGYAAYHELITPEKYAHLYVHDRLRLYDGSQNKLSRAISEWSDGDSVCLHIAYGIDFFCTRDDAKNAKVSSVFHPLMVASLKERFDFNKVTPEYLVHL
jgi:hypothetical protein